MQRTPCSRYRVNPLGHRRSGAQAGGKRGETDRKHGRADREQAAVLVPKAGPAARPARSSPRSQRNPRLIRIPGMHNSAPRASVGQTSVVVADIVDRRRKIRQGARLDAVSNGQEGRCTKGLGDGERLLLVVERDDDQHRAEDLLAGDGHVVGHVGEDPPCVTGQRLARIGRAPARGRRSNSGVSRACTHTQAVA